MTPETDAAIRNAANAAADLLRDLRGSESTGTLGAGTRNVLRAVINAATSIEALADDLKGFHGPFSARTTGQELRAALQRIGSKP